MVLVNQKFLNYLKIIKKKKKKKKNEHTVIKLNQIINHIDKRKMNFGNKINSVINVCFRNQIVDLFILTTVKLKI